MQEGRAFWPVLTLVLLGHGAVLTQLTASPPVDLARGLAAPPLRVFQVRPVQPPDEPEPAAAPVVAAPVATAPGPAPEPPAAPPPAPAPQPPPQAAAPPPPDPPYVPRSQLTAAPTLLAPVDVGFPDSVRGVVDLKVQLTLFIDEQGVVQRVRIDTPGVPPVFEQAVRDTFVQARFKPGEIEAVPVRSQVRLEVEFNAASTRRR